MLTLAGPAIAQPNVLTAASEQASAPSPEKLDMARRLLAITDYRGSFTEKTRQSILDNAGGASVLSKAPGLYEAAVRKAVAAHTADLARVGEARVELYARIYTDKDLRAMLAHFESPVGQSILTKFRGHVALTPEEITVQRAYLAGPVKAADARTTVLLDQVQLISFPLENLIYTESVLDFCAAGGPCNEEFRAVWEEERKEVEAFRPYRGPRATEKYALALRVIRAENFSPAQMISLVRMTAPVMLPDPATREVAIDKAIAANRSEIARIEDEVAQRYVMAFREKELRVFLAYLESPAGQSYFMKQVAAEFGIPEGSGKPPPALTPEEGAAHDAYMTYFTKIPTGESTRNNAEEKFAPLIGKIFNVARQDYCTVRPNCQQEMLDRGEAAKKKLEKSP